MTSTENLTSDPAVEAQQPPELLNPDQLRQVGAAEQVKALDALYHDPYFVPSVEHLSIGQSAAEQIADDADPALVASRDLVRHYSSYDAWDDMPDEDAESLHDYAEGNDVDTLPEWARDNIRGELDKYPDNQKSFVEKGFKTWADQRATLRDTIHELRSLEAAEPAEPSEPAAPAAPAVAQPQPQSKPDNRNHPGRGERSTRGGRKPHRHEGLGQYDQALDDVRVVEPTPASAAPVAQNTAPATPTTPNPGNAAPQPNTAPATAPGPNAAPTPSAPNTQPVQGTPEARKLSTADFIEEVRQHMRETPPTSVEELKSYQELMLSRFTEFKETRKIRGQEVEVTHILDNEGRQLIPAEMQDMVDNRQVVRPDAVQKLVNETSPAAWELSNEELQEATRISLANRPTDLGKLTRSALARFKQAGERDDTQALARAKDYYAARIRLNADIRKDDKLSPQEARAMERQRHIRKFANDKVPEHLWDTYAKDMGVDLSDPKVVKDREPYFLLSQKEREYLIDNYGNTEKGIENFRADLVHKTARSSQAEAAERALLALGRHERRGNRPGRVTGEARKVPSQIEERRVAVQALMDRTIAEKGLDEAVWSFEQWKGDRTVDQLSPFQQMYDEALRDAVYKAQVEQDPEGSAEQPAPKPEKFVAEIAANGVWKTILGKRNTQPKAETQPEPEAVVNNTARVVGKGASHTNRVHAGRSHGGKKPNRAKMTKHNTKK